MNEDDRKQIGMLRSKGMYGFADNMEILVNENERLRNYLMELREKTPYGLYKEQITNVLRDGEKPDLPRCKGCRLLHAVESSIHQDYCDDCYKGLKE